MSAAPPLVLLSPPPLPPGWSEHIGPHGQAYYYNALTQESTYVRPIPAFPIMPIAQPEPSKTKKKEKPLSKTPIPNTDWLRVKTTAGNIFYSHKVKKESVWTVPDEIKDAVQKLEQEEQERLTVATDEALKADHEDAMEVEKVKEEVQAMVKRRAEDSVPVDAAVITKKAKVEDVNEEDSSEESEEEEWQREAAAQLAAEAEVERIRLEEEAERERKEAEEQVKRLQSAQLNMPERVDLSIEEGKALFKTLLREKDINPLHPWDASLPKFVSDPRYVLLPSVAARREAFDEYCRDRARELRQSIVKKEKEALTPQEDFERLLRDEVKSTKTNWTDFRRKWKKDRQFYGWGRDDKEREKKFREYIKDLGEKKRTLAEKAEVDFFSLLREKGDVEEGSVWKDIKRKLYSDPRYDAVGSASLREELFNTFLKGSRSLHTSQAKTPALTVVSNPEGEEWGDDIGDDENQRRRKERKERAVKEREQKVKADRDRLEADIGRSRMDVHKEEGEREFMSLLTDAIRDPQMTWDAALPQLKTDPRFRNSPLPVNQQLHLFHSHIGRLRSKHIDNLQALFEAHAPFLAIDFGALPTDSLLASLPAIKLGYNTRDLQREFIKWQDMRTKTFRKAFDEMLTENSFVEFWGRLGKIGGEGVDGGVKADDADGDEGESGGGKVDMKALAKNVDVEDMEKVLKNDKRYVMFDHMPEQRERWIRDYLSNLSAPKLSVHIAQHAGPLTQ